MNTNGKLASALVLVSGQTLFSPAERATILEGAAQLATRGEPYTRQEGKLLDLADRLRLREPAQEVDPKALEAANRAIAQAAAERVPLAVLHDKALGAFLILNDEVAQLARRGQVPSDDLRERVKAAESDWQSARSALERATVRLVSAQQARQRRKADLLLAAQ